jgi:hypothetical protein
LGNGKHDWHYLLDQLGILPQAEAVGLVFLILGTMVFLAAIFLPLFLEK